MNVAHVELDGAASIKLVYLKGIGNIHIIRQRFQQGALAEGDSVELVAASAKHQLEVFSLADRVRAQHAAVAAAEQRAGV